MGISLFIQTTGHSSSSLSNHQAKNQVENTAIGIFEGALRFLLLHHENAIQGATIEDEHYGL